MPFCINCGAQNQEDSRFCISCGQVLYQEPKSIVSNRKRTWSLTAAISVLVAAVICVILVASLSKDQRQTSPNVPNKPVAAPLPVSDDAVLTLVGRDRNGSTLSQGSGFLISSDGLAVTNYHVLQGVTRAVAECCGGRTFQVHTIEGADLGKDLVVFQLYDNADKPSDLPYLRVSSSENLPVGEKVIVIGSPQGLENTVSDGILSAVREYDSIRYLQITAPISPGSSGGPVLDQTGEVIGIATFQFKKGQNLNFAVDSKYVGPILKEHFGVSMAEFESLVAEAQREQRENEHPRAANGVSRNQQATSDSLTGSFIGTVDNENSNTSAQFEILIQDTQGSLSGCMGVLQPLYGSGPLRGSEAGSGVTFVVSSDLGEITFVGRRNEKGAIHGWYTVRHQDGSTEYGTFSLEKRNSKGPGRNFDTTTCPTDSDMNKPD